VAKFDADTPMKRPAQPEGIAPAYVFLASAQTASYIAGEVLPILEGLCGGPRRRVHRPIGRCRPNGATNEP
jgi:NAD(P)-dependent dehydrogenase (short-subunit alcohol dehydrogenase family)